MISLLLVLSTAVKRTLPQIQAFMKLLSMKKTSSEADLQVKGALLLSIITKYSYGIGVYTWQMDYINISHPNFIGGSMAMEIPLQQQWGTKGGSSVNVSKAILGSRACNCYAILSLHSCVCFKVLLPLFFLENWGFGINTRFQYLKPCFYMSC
ncbi:unnamed protein product [Sphagnum jensenii]